MEPTAVAALTTPRIARHHDQRPTAHAATGEPPRTATVGLTAACDSPIEATSRPRIGDGQPPELCLHGLPDGRFDDAKVRLLHHLPVRAWPQPRPSPTAERILYKDSLPVHPPPAVLLVQKDHAHSTGSPAFAFGAAPGRLRREGDLLRIQAMGNRAEAHASREAVEDLTDRSASPGSMVRRVREPGLAGRVRPAAGSSTGLER